MASFYLLVTPLATSAGDELIVAAEMMWDRDGE